MVYRMIGVSSVGAYLPRRRLARASIVAANAWGNPALAALAAGERTMCGWDEDSVTLATAAVRQAMGTTPVHALYLASTSFPFADRSNAVLVAEAAGLPASLRTLESAGTRRAGTAALLCALDAARAAPGKCIAVAAAEHRVARVGTLQELSYGDGAAALVVGSEQVIAEFMDAHTHAVDFLDQYRSEGQRGVYQWEERWIRDEGYLQIIPNAVDTLLKRTGIAAREVAHVVLPGGTSDAAVAIANKIGIDPESIVDSLHSVVGDTGAAHPLLLFNEALARARSGELILVTSFGQGCDALLFRATQQIDARRAQLGLARWLARRTPEDNYSKYQSFNGLVDRDPGKRAEMDRQMRPSAFHRHRDFLTSFRAAVCGKCGAVQAPRGLYCVNPGCAARAEFSERSLAEVQGTVRTWTADRLTFDPDPPAYFGTVDFDGGGRLLMDFTDVNAGSLQVGTRVEFHFRIRDIDAQRNFRRYFWKAVPL
jgi:3-hydroxy-3-methylglutaryl CoA synthase